MKLNTRLIDEIETKKLTEKTKRLCQLNKCGLYDLIVLSIDYHASNNNNNIMELSNDKRNS